jgi:hypothetical protein
MALQLSENDIQQNYIQHNNKKCDTQHECLIVITLSIAGIKCHATILSVINPIVALINCYAECHHYAECGYAEYHYAKCCYAECSGTCSTTRIKTPQQGMSEIGFLTYTIVFKMNGMGF